MRSVRQNGFVSVLVIATIALIGVEILVLAGGSNAILFQSNTAYLDACEQNLIASGLAWAELNVKNQSRETFNRIIELDVTNMNIRGATLNLTIGNPRDKSAEVQINTSCSRGKQTIRYNRKYRIECKP